MAFLIFACLLIGVVAFFHYVQGFFSATLSAMIAMLSAIFAVSYHENVVNMLLKGRMADYAHSIVLCILFIVSYIVLRVIFDLAIPGNVRTPSIVDKVGAGLMGIIAGIFAVGIFTIAVQMLPFDPPISFMGYARYDLTGSRNVVVPQAGGRQSLDSHVDNEIVAKSLDPALDPENGKPKGLLFPIDDMVLDTVYHVSDGGTLAGDRSLASVHPDYLDELFGERLGIQTSARRVALAVNGADPVQVTGLYTAATLPCKDGGIKEIRPSGYVPLFKDTVKPGPGQSILVVRVAVGNTASDDEDSIFRFSTGSIHLVGQTKDGWKDFYPIGTLYSDERTVLLNKPDDFLFVKDGDSFDAVFLVDSDLTAAHQVKDGTFISVKRFGLVDLSGQTIKDRIPADGASKLIRSPVLVKQLSLPPAPAVTAAPEQPEAPAPTRTPTPAPAPAQAVTPTPPATPVAPTIPADKPISEDVSANVSTALASSISIGTPDREAKDAPVPGGKITLQGGSIAVASINPVASLSDLSQGANPATDFLPAQNTSMVQVGFKPYTNDFSFFQSLGNAKLNDANGNTYDAMGIYMTVKNNDVRGLYLRYNFEHNLASNPNVLTPDGAPDGTVYLLFLVKAGADTEIKSLTLGDKTQNLSAATKVP